MAKAKAKTLYKARVPVTHGRRNCHGNSDWLVSVIKYGRKYDISCSEYGFCNIDDRVVRAILSPHKELMSKAFHGWYKQGWITRNATWSGVGNMNSYIAGIKTEGTALEIAKWFEGLAKRTLASIPKEDLDRDSLLTADVKIVAIEKAREFSSSIQDEVMQKFNNIGIQDAI